MGPDQKSHISKGNQPDIVIVSSDPTHFSSLQSLLSAVNTPQVRVVSKAEDVPSATKIVIACDESYHEHDYETWKLDTPEDSISPSEPVSLFADNLDYSHIFSNQLVTSSSPTSVMSRDPLLNTTEVTTYYAIKRLAKAADAKDPQIDFEYQCLSSILSFLSLDKILDSHFYSNSRRTTTTKTSFSDENDLHRYLLSLVDNFRVKSEIKLTIEYLLRSALGKGINKPNFCLSNTAAKLINKGKTDWIPRIQNGTTLAYLGFFSLLRNNTRISDLSRELLFDDQFFDDQARSIRSYIGSTGYCYSPILASYLLLLTMREGGSTKLTLGSTTTADLAWNYFKHSSSPIRIQRGSEKYSLFDQEQKKISKSLVTNVCAQLEIPTLDSLQFELSKSNFHPNFLVLANVWRGIFHFLLESIGKPLVTVKPWPANAKAAIALRYDVDRHTSLTQLSEIDEIQKSFGIYPCTTWYFKSDDNHSQELRDRIVKKEIELGTHRVKSSDPAKGVGVTCHSGPGSLYWRGSETLTWAESKKAQYVELLSANLGLPIKLTQYPNVWTVPMSFPLEGSTDELSLDYFNLLRKEFNATLKNGGFVVIGSHPDVDQQKLSVLLKELALSEIWFAPTADILSRSKMIRELDIQLDDDAKNATIHSKCDIKQLRIEIISNKQNRLNKVADLKSGKSEIISLL